jgi:pyruvate ferredoxin oxidoreductase beta subunit
MGSMTTAARRSVDKLRHQGKKIGLVKLRFVRPFPHAEFREIADKVEAIGVVDRMVLHGTGGGGVFADLKSALYNLDERPKVLNFITGMGGEDIPIDDFTTMGEKILEVASGKRVEKEVLFIEHTLQRGQEPIMIDEEMTVFPGSEGCAGCGSSIVIRHLLDILGPQTVVVNPPSCSSVNYMAVSKNPWILANYAAAAGYETGIYRAYKHKGKADQIYVTCFSGDGGTVDIGLQGISGAAERRESMIWICYDNEAYMNTGIQRSSSTPLYAATTSTPVGKIWKGKQGNRKNMILIMAAHRIPYIATGSIAHLRDLERKIKKAADVTRSGKGLAYIHIQQPCATGWYFPPEKTVEVGRLAVQTGEWPILEIEEGILTLNIKPSKLKPITEYLNLQRRFSHLTERDVEEIQEEVKKNWNSWLTLEEMGKLPWY